MSEHIVKRYDDELADLKNHLLEMGGMVERMISDAMLALTRRDEGMAHLVIDFDRQVDAMEVAIDALAIRLLALRQPAARDLRLIATAMKINTDLERIGDTAVNLAERAKELLEEPQLKPLVDLPRMAELALRMLKDALDAFVAGDVAAARRVLDRDDEIDDLYVQIFRELLTYMMADPKAIARGMRLTFCAKYLERIADHATNIAEMVTFLVEGEDIRHRDAPREPGSL